jgi:hypothetical protein
MPIKTRYRALCRRRQSRSAQINHQRGALHAPGGAVQPGPGRTSQRR